jgi:2-desacetyl-2-hydroxyethyl bacteriochlorophyllide A dehydrogenase
MRGLWIEQGKLTLREDLTPTPERDAVEIKVKLAGVCGTDLELLRGYYEFAGVPGHEFIGEVVSGGSWQGKRVVADINFGCGQCRFCRRDLPHHCLDRRTLGINQSSGAFAERIAVPAANLIEVPKSVPDEHAVFAEPLAAALQILEQVDLSRRSVLLVGAGRLGRMIAWVIDRLVPDADLTIALRNPERKRQLPEDAAVKSLDEITRQYSVAIDCTGNANGFAVALDGLEAKGTLVVKSTYAEELQLDMSRIVVDEITVLGSRCGPMDKAVDFLEQYPEVFKTNNRVLALDDYKTAFHLARDSSIDKVLFQT